MDRFAKGLTYFYGITVVVAAIPYGLVQTVAFTGICVIMFLFAFISMAILGKPKRGGHVFTGSLFLFLILCAWILLQSYGSYPFHLPDGSILRDVYAQAGLSEVKMSLEPSDTLNALLYLALPAMTFFAGLIVTQSDQDAATLLRILSIGGGLIASFGLMQFLMAPHSLLMIEKEAYIDSVTAVFVNRNTAATYLGLVVLLLATFSMEKGREYFTRSSYGPESDLRGVYFAVSVALAAVAFTSLMLTQSRGGIFAFGVAALFYFPSLALDDAHRHASLPLPTQSRKILIWGRWLLVIVLIGAVFGLFASRALFRASVNGLEDGRFCVWPDITRAIGEHWLYGTGFGTFRTAFSAYRDPSCGIAGVFDRAHNSYLEALLTLGAIFPVVLAAFLFLIGKSFWHGYRHRKRMKQVAMLGAGGTILVAVHALVDFSLQIPGFAVLYAAFLAATISICHGRDTKRDNERRNPRKMAVQNA